MMRSVIHPGPIANDRLDLAPAEGREITLVLQQGRPLEQAVAEAMAAEGLESAWIEIRDAGVTSLDYVIPALTPDATHVAWYSDVHCFDGPGKIDHLGMMVGMHQGASFLHGHGLWTPRGGRQAMGHILAPRTVLDADVTAHGIGLTGARFERLHDAETNFDLFQTVRTGPAGCDFAALRVRPNQDFVTALKTACAELSWDGAHVHGLGSLIGAHFDNGDVLDSLPTEFLILDASVGVDADHQGPEIVIVGIDGETIMSGRLMRGQNPVLITAELILSRITS